MPVYVALERSTVEEDAPGEQEQTSLVREFPDDEPTTDGEPTAGQWLADHEGVGAEEPSLSPAGSGGQVDAKVQDADEAETNKRELAADQDHVAYAQEQSAGALAQESTVEFPLVHVEFAPDNDELHWSSDWSLGNGDSKQDVIDAARDVIAEPDEMASHRDENVVNGWYLYADAYPVNVTFDDISDKELDWSSSWDSDDLDSAVGPDHDEPQLGDAESKNDDKRVTVVRVRTEENSQEKSSRSVDHGHFSNGHQRQRDKDKQRDSA
jgi:hypothetical protein